MSLPILVDSYKVDLLDGIHQADDIYKIALYTPDADLSATTATYQSLHEIPATGTYRAGGLELEGRHVSWESRGVILTWAPAIWQRTTIRAAFALIYNASRQNRAIAVIAFEALVQSVNGPFVVDLPHAQEGQGIVVIP